MVRIFAFSDTHCGPLPEIAQNAIDAWAFAGDMYEADLSAQDPEGLHRIESWASSREKPVYCVRGNHDGKDPARFFARFRDLSPGKVERVQGSLFIAGIGWAGGAYHQLPANTDFMTHWENLDRGRKSLTGDARFILLTHYPPRLEQSSFPSRDASKCYDSIARIMDDLQPVAVVLGHVHKWFGTSNYIGSTLVVSPGPAGGTITVDMDSGHAGFQPLRAKE